MEAPLSHPLNRALLGICCAAVVAGCSKKNLNNPDGPITAAVDSSKAASTLALPVVGEPVRQGDLILTVSATGEIRSDATSQLTAQAAGNVQEVLIRPGDEVKAGQPLFRLDPKPLDLDVRSAAAAVASANVQYQTNITSDSIAEGKVRPERRNFLRAQAGIEAAETGLERARLARENAVINAPFDGVIESVNIAKGDHVNAGQIVATIVDMVHLRVDAQVLEHDLPLLRTGGDAVVTVAAFPDQPVHGTIAAVLPMVDSATRAGRAVIRITGNGRLRPGMYADVRLEASRLTRRIIVPARAVIERDNRPLVFVARQGRAEWVYVNAGRSNGRETEILADSATGTVPLQVGDTVITEGNITLSHQAPIKLTAKKPQ